MALLRPVLVPIAVVIVLAGLITHSTNAASGDPVHYMMIAKSVAFDRDLDLANDYADPADILQPEQRHAVPGKDGKLRPLHDVGFPVVVAPAFGIAYRFAEWTDSWSESLRRRLKFNRAIALRPSASRSS